MKKNMFTIIALCILCVIGCRKELSSIDDSRSVEQFDQYYWSDGQKIELAIDSSEFVIEIDSSINSNQAATKLSFSNIGRALRGRNQPYKLIVERSLIKNGAVSFEGTTVKIRDMCPIYKNRETKFRHDGTILVVPKPDKSIEEVIQYTRGEVDLIRTSPFGYYVLKPKEIRNTLLIANKIFESGIVTLSHPDFILELHKNSMPNDPLFSFQRNLHSDLGHHINIVRAWEVATSSTNEIKVAVIDDGIEPHTEFPDNLVSGYTPVAPSNLGRPNPSIQSIRHGQAVARIIAAKKNNGQNIAGIADFVKIMPINIFYGGESVSHIADAINWARINGADIIHNSWTYQTVEPIQIVTDAITNAVRFGRNNKGCVVVFSSGNYNLIFRGVAFPANLRSVISVGAIGYNGIVSNYSSRGPNLDLVAPSDSEYDPTFYTIDRMGILGYSSGDYTEFFGGTSAAAPQVAGVAALLLRQNPNLSATQIKDILTSTARDIGELGYDETYGHGLLDAYSSLRRVQNRNSIFSGPSNICSEGIFEIYSGGTISLENANGVASLTNLGNSTYRINRIGTANGAVQLTVRNGGNTMSTTVFIGLPNGNDITNYSQGNLEPYGVYYFTIPSGYNIDSFEWSVAGGTIVAGRHSSEVTVRVDPNPYQGTNNFSISLSFTSACGSGAIHTSRMVNSSPGGGGIPYDPGESY